ncbi:glycosyltransferase family 4 protein [Cercospora zeae-maydis SCOH1-5]|uniref:Glycosyltransferase family 4 protein n=1 Tax=Cercospora zeae-maydis SCOH1-5 TaxID=717836 RepID=A0A6A6FTD1_9PEZI|nr:glycosyltransferase family 4 protein [Cercospora zeae-maydis SCOH1-5]
MRVEYIGLSAVGWHVMTGSWYDIVRRLRKVPPGVKDFLDGLRSKGQSISADARGEQDARTFGVYLGNFAIPPTQQEMAILSKWDIVVLDPAQTGVLNAAASHCSSAQILGRIDIRSVVDNGATKAEEDLVLALESITNFVSSRFRGSNRMYSPMTAILLANWQSKLPPLVCQELIRHLKGLNFDVYLELSEPEYLTDEECRHIGMDLIKGLICRNGTILHNGDRRDYYQMSNMRRAQRALAKHMSLGGVVFAMWETLDDMKALSHSVASRSYLWCRFNTALNWIGSELALKDTDAAHKATLAGVPLGALMWMKGLEVMTLHDTWRLNDSIAQGCCHEGDAFTALEDYVPGIGKMLELLPAQGSHTPESRRLSVIDAGFPIKDLQTTLKSDALSFSPEGEDYTGLGCFQTGLPASQGVFDMLRDGQRKLRDLNMLDRLGAEALQEIGARLRPLLELSEQFKDFDGMAEAVGELLNLLAVSDGQDTDRLRIYMGIHSGFHRDTSEQFWGLYDNGMVALAERRGSHPGYLDLFISLRTGDRALAILHTWLSMKRFSRTQCLKAEWLLCAHSQQLEERWELPKRMVDDVVGLTSPELILLMQRLTHSNDPGATGLGARMIKLCRHQLMAIPTRDQLRKQNTAQYLRGEISPVDLIKNRLAWYRDQGCHAPGESAALEVFETIDRLLPKALMDQDDTFVEKIQGILGNTIRKLRIDAAIDIFALSVFCAYRRLALEEIYLEVLDRNPLPNRHPDQAACFAEMFGTGSQCETYLDMTSNVLGRILADKYQSYYTKHQPVARKDGSSELPTSYASKSVDEDPDAQRPTLPIYYQITFLGIFAVPALFDIMMLTILGRGLYLSNYMGESEKIMATAGLMSGLLLCGGIGTWIGYGGSYYLHAMSFPAMNMFVLTRFVAGVALLTIIGLVAFITIGIVRSWYDGFIFVFYFAALDTYLTVLATLAIYQFPGFMFQSGRNTVVMCLPVLLISPILTLWVHKDIIIYPCVVTTFICCLILGARSVISQWGTWYLKVPTISDTEVVHFYTEVTPPEEVPKISDLAATPLPRKAFFAALEKERNRWPWQKSEAGELIKKHVAGYDATVFLMDWYCKYSRTAMPYPYSPTWNLMVKTAIDTIREMQKGLKLHNAFIHWRFGGDEVWCGVLYFLIALMDKWVALVTGHNVVGLSDAGNPVYRLAVGFSLAYYLIAAVCLDAVAQPLWPMANKKIAQPITSLAFLKQAALNDAKARRKLYWTNWAKFFFSHLWGFAISASLMWTFQSAKSATIMFMAYTGAYSGLLWYQYNRIYTGPSAMNDLICAAICGIAVGVTIRTHSPDFVYGAVIGLATATWLAAILSWRTANVGWPKPLTDTEEGIKNEDVLTFSSVGPWPYFSQRTLSDLYKEVQNLPSEERMRVDPNNSIGAQAVQIIQRSIGREQSPAVKAAFPKTEQMLNMAIIFWKQDALEVTLVSSRYAMGDQKKLRAIAKVTQNRTHLIIFVHRYVEFGQQSQIIAEAVVRVTAETKLALPRDQAALVDLLVADVSATNSISLPEGIKRHLDATASERARVIKYSDAEYLRGLLMGLDSEKQWDDLPPIIRTFLLERCLGHTSTISEAQVDWIRGSFFGDRFTTIQMYIARCNLSIMLGHATKQYARAKSAEYCGPDDNGSELTDRFQRFRAGPIPLNRPETLFGKIRYRIRATYKGWRFAVKFYIIALTGEPEYQRELDYFIADKPWFAKYIVRFLLNGAWMYAKALQWLIIPRFMFHGREDIHKLQQYMRGTKSTMIGEKVTIEKFDGAQTGFLYTKGNGVTTFNLYNGRHDTKPADTQHLISTSTYISKCLQLEARKEYVDGQVTNSYRYLYDNSKDDFAKLPISRICDGGEKEGEVMHYDDRGYVVSGSYTKDDNLTHFKYRYRRKAKYDDELIRAEYSMAYMTIKVSWCYPPPEKKDDLMLWIPSPKVVECTYTLGSDVYRCWWNYDHRSHPTIHTTMNGQTVMTPDKIRFDHYQVLAKPRKNSFLVDNPLISFRNQRSNALTRLFKSHEKWYPISTGAARNILWKTWKGTKDLDAVSIRWLDEMALRRDRVLTAYWLRRDLGLLHSARAYFQSNADSILARTDLDPEVSSWSSIAFRYGDLDNFGQGGDARINTRAQSTQIRDTHDTLNVLAMDTGTWPNEGGGVSACRRDVVNDLSTIRWHVVAENANDFGVPKFQTECNIQSLTVLPLWGMDFLTPHHGVFEGILDSAVQRRSNHTYHADIETNFLPILTSLIKCARAIRFGPEHIEEASQALVDLSNYFAKDRHWTETWMSEPVKRRWRELWLAEDVENAVPISKWWDAELPTLAHMDNALDMWHRFLFIFTLDVPETIPDVFQASHHFCGASYGVLCKLKRNCTLHVWDHCISWREVTVFLSSAMSFDAPFVCTSLIHLSRMTSVLILHYADVVLPCADFFNPGWEVEHGTQEGILGHRKAFARKIDPVVNGICNMENFVPIKKIKSKKPTITMLSHVRFVKDIKNAILAADIIVNEWGFKDYQLDVYGDMEKAPAYSVECKEILASKGLRDYVALRGLGSPSKVLEEAWIFLNSSVSEGLPLAMGEAALTGVPVVCTDVGASFRVVTDPVTWKKFSAVVAPNDAYSLARAQVEVLALLGEWSQYAEDAPGEHHRLPLHPGKEEVDQITKRMYAKEDQRRKLGMMGRANVLNSFSSHRYLREHEQMLWVGKTQSPSYLARSRLSLSWVGWCVAHTPPPSPPPPPASVRLSNLASRLHGRSTDSATVRAHMEEKKKKKKKKMAGPSPAPK